MGHMKEGLCLKFLLRTSQQIVVFILLTHFCEGQSQPVMTMVGDDVVLPCQLEPPADVTPRILEWSKPDLKPRFVYVWHNGQELAVDQNKAYKGRTSLFIDKLKHGDISLKLSKVKISDEGKYRCYIPDLEKEYFVELLVAAVSLPGIGLVRTDRSSSRVVLQCESKGWNPQPEVFWQDGEGNLLSAGPTETVRGPDGLYTVSSRVTVENKHSNNFTCRVQQNNINQTRETYIIIPDDFFMAPSSCAACITTSVLFSVMFILAVAIFIWKWRYYKTEIKKENEEQLQTESKNIEYLELKLNKELQQKEEEKKNVEQLIDALVEQKKELVSQKEQITVQMEKTEELKKENNTKVNAVDEEISGKEGDKTENKATGYLKLKEIISETNWNLDERRQEQQVLILNTDKIMGRTDVEFKRMTDKKKQVENNMKEINKQLENIYRQREEIQKKLESEEKGNVPPMHQTTPHFESNTPMAAQADAGQSQPVMTMVGDDVVLPCQLEPPADAAPMILEWSKPDLDPRFVFVWHNNQELVVDQNKAYKGRTSLFIDKLKHGDVSLKLSKVKISDEGKYRCYFPKLNKECFVDLLVGAVSSPVISLVGNDQSSSGVVLQCESKGWNPKPEVFWQDDEGNLLSAEPTEAVRGPDGLYNVSSRVTVENKHSNNFTCRVQQNHIYQTRETYIIIPDDFFMAPSSCAACITTSVLFSVMFILTVAIFVWKWRHYKTEIKMHKKNKNEEQLQTESKNIEDLELKLNKELQQKEEEKKNVEQLIDALVEQKKELVSQKEQITVQMEKTEELYKENNTKVNAVDEEISGKEGDKTENKATGYLKLKEIISGTNWNLDERRQEQQLLIFNTDKIMGRTDVEFKRMTDKKKQVENNMKEINKQLENIFRQREEIQKKLESEEKGLVFG
ncbi:uncharacterized protein LOC134006224 [Scomber scombrus]|uniref:uncharacterized protein LOC134006224 n=1 Tax=Scomber scombrus TaxID=13677 RepID=UPI002DDAEEF9|nr:uncharacterized protein LOC134006224 [Scomber scombrus]